MPYDMLYLNQGIHPYLDKVRTQGKNVPMNKRAFVLYHMAKQNVFDPEIVQQMEANLVVDKSELKGTQSTGILLEESHITARYAFGAVISYWKMNWGTAFGLKYWEDFMVS